MKTDVLFPLLELLPSAKKRQALDNMRIQRVSDGEIIYERGEDCTDAFFIFDGKVKFCAFGPQGEMAFFWRRSPGGLFGFYSAITGQPQTTTAIAVEETILGRMDSETFMDLALSDRAVSEYMLKLVTNMLRSESNRVAYLITMEAPIRVVAEILDYAAASGSEVISLPMRVEMAARLGMTRETLARHLSDLSKKGLIKIEKNSIHILNIQKLADIIE